MVNSRKSLSRELKHRPRVRSGGKEDKRTGAEDNTGGWGGGDGGELRTGGQDSRTSGSTVESWNTGLKVRSGKKIRVKDSSGEQEERKGEDKRTELKHKPEAHIRI